MIENEEQPKLQEAFDAILSMNPNDIKEVVSMKCPPQGVMLTVRALSSLLNVPPERMRDPAGKMANNFWTSSRKAFFKNHASLIASLKSYDVDINPSETISKL